MFQDRLKSKKICFLFAHFFVDILFFCFVIFKFIFELRCLLVVRVAVAVVEAVVGGSSAGVESRGSSVLLERVRGVADDGGGVLAVAGRVEGRGRGGGVVVCGLGWLNVLVGDGGGCDGLVAVLVGDRGGGEGDLLGLLVLVGDGGGGRGGEVLLLLLVLVGDRGGGDLVLFLLDDGDGGRGGDVVLVDGLDGGGYGGGSVGVGEGGGVEARGVAGVRGVACVGCGEGDRRGGLLLDGPVNEEIKF